MTSVLQRLQRSWLKKWGHHLFGSATLTQDANTSNKIYSFSLFHGQSNTRFRFHEPTPGQPTKRKTKSNEKENRKMTKETKTKQLK